MNINDRYKELTKNAFTSLNVTVKAFIPKPSESDYIKGYVTRYFTQSTNDINSPIYEISSNEFGRLNNVVTYVTTTLRWRLTGPRETIYDDNGNIVDKGVLESNRISIQLASVVIKNLNLYLPNLLQFRKYP